MAQHKLLAQLMKRREWLYFVDAVEILAGGSSVGSGLRFGFGAGGLGGDFKAVFVHVEALLAVEALDELAGGFADGSGKVRGVYSDGRASGLFASILILKSHLKCFHTLKPPIV